MPHKEQLMQALKIRLELQMAIYITDFKPKPINGNIINLVVYMVDTALIPPLQKKSKAYVVIPVLKSLPTQQITLSAIQ